MSRFVALDAATKTSPADTKTPPSPASADSRPLRDPHQPRGAHPAAMNAAEVAVPQIAKPVVSAGRAHSQRIRAAYVVTGLIALALLINGMDYYWLPQAQRALSPKHFYLKPSGRTGLLLGEAGVLLFLGLYLYPVRKRWAWLAKQGNSQRWLDVHVLLGLAAPVIITFHSSFKFGGIAGIAYWVMIIVALSGVVGRYIYTQIPRNLTSVEVALREAREQGARLALKLNSLEILSESDVERLIGLPSAIEAQQMPLLLALWKMMVFDLTFPLRIRALRQEMLWSRRRIWTLIGFKRGPNAILERAIDVAREQAVVTKKTLFLSKSYKLFHLWHVVHRPFSYSFALLASIHVALMLMLGYY